MHYYALLLLCNIAILELFVCGRETDYDWLQVVHWQLWTTYLLAVFSLCRDLVLCYPVSSNFQIIICMMRCRNCNCAATCGIRDKWCWLIQCVQIEKQVARLPGGQFYPRPVGHDLPLTLQMPSFTPLTSADWLAKHGLKGNVYIQLHRRRTLRFWSVRLYATKVKKLLTDFVGSFFWRSWAWLGCAL